MTPSSPAPKRGSNSEFVAGGIYPGGTGTIKDIYYRLWDYNGALPPNSQMCVECVFAPNDNSNDGKDVTVNWSVGPSNSYTPDPADPGFYLDLKGGGHLIDSSNWHFVQDTGFVKNCGLDAKLLDGPTGIRCLIGSELTLVRRTRPSETISLKPLSLPGSSRRLPSASIKSSFPPVLNGHGR